MANEEVAGALGIDPSPRMIECGFRVLVESGITDDPMEADKLLIGKIWLAMEACRLQELEPGGS